MAFAVTEEMFRKADLFLFDDGGNIEAQIEIIYNKHKENPSQMIDHIDGVSPIEQFEYVFTAQGFLKIIGAIK